jgi:16S rRNA (guanine1207-N2)-methyltransferase
MVDFVSKPGLPAWDRVSAASRLLAEEIVVKPDDRVCYLGCGHGAAAAAIAGRLVSGEIWLIDPNVIALRCARLTCDSNQVKNAFVMDKISLLPEHAKSFQVVIIELPKGRQLARRWLVEAHALLVDGGSLYLAGANESGAQSMIKDAHELFGNSGILAYKKGSRLARCNKIEEPLYSPPDWALDAGIAPGSWSSYWVELDEDRFELQTLPGVFSQGGLDEGTRLLLHHMPAPFGSSILDIGCGAGVIGLAIARRLYAQGKAPSITMVDSSLLATACAQENARRSQIPGIQVQASDLLEGLQGQQFDQILTNPPFHAGVEVNYAISEELIAQSHAALVPGGELILVANRFIRYNMLITAIFRNLRCIYQNRQYHVLAATK